MKYNANNVLSTMYDVQSTNIKKQITCPFPKDTCSPDSYRERPKVKMRNLASLIIITFFSLHGRDVFSQNTGISTDGTLPETGVMLDVKGTTDKTVTATSTLFQIKSFNTSTNELKMRLILHSDAAGVASRYGQIDVADYTLGTPTYVNLLFQPAGGNVGIGTTSPTNRLHINNGAVSAFAHVNYGLSVQSPTFGVVIQTDNNNASGALRVLTNSGAIEALRVQNDGNVGIGTVAPNTLFDVNGSIAYREGTALTLVNGGNNDITLGAFSYFRITGPTATFTISGFTGGVDGRIVTVYNTTTQIMTIANDVTSTAANRIYTMKGADIVTPAGPNVIQLQYNTNVSRWLVIGGQNLTASGSSSAGSWLVYTSDGF